MEKTKYEFKCDKDIALNIINSFLQANNYKQRTSEQGKIYYEFGDAVVIGFLEYEIKDELTTIYAYLRSEKKPMPLDDSFVGMLPKNHYKGVIQPLLEKLANPTIENNNSNIIESNTTINTELNSEQIKDNSSYNQFAEKYDESKSKIAIFAFALSIIGLLLSFMGLSFGVIIIVLEYAFAVQGLKSSKRNLSIAAIIIASITFVINIVTLISVM